MQNPSKEYAKILVFRDNQHMLNTVYNMTNMVAEVAERINVNPSTITRAVRGKYIQSPRQTILIKALFTAKVSKGTGDIEVNAKDIQELLKKWICTEDKRKPYSDAKLVSMLEEKGIRISRRAVAKYRDIMGIKGSFDRKE